MQKNKQAKTKKKSNSKFGFKQNGGNYEIKN